MSSFSQNDYDQEIENKKFDEEDIIITKYILDLKQEETRDEALKNLYIYAQKSQEKIALYLWYSGGTLAILLQELIKLYQYLPPFNSKKISKESSSKSSYILFLFQCLASNKEIKKKLIETEIIVYIFPFLSINKISTISLRMRLLALNIINSLFDYFDNETFDFLKQNEIIPILLKIALHGKDFGKNIACHILSIIFSNERAIEYFCEVKERMKAVTYTFGQMLINDEGLKFKKLALKILMNLTENKEAKNMIKKDLLELFKNYRLYENLDENTKIKLKQLEKNLLDKDKDKELETCNNTNNNIKIEKLKNDLTINSSAKIKNENINNESKKKEEINLNNLNLKTSHSFNTNNNSNQKPININSGDFNNNNKLNINMIYINNINQINMNNGYMMPSIGDFNLNKDNNEAYMNPNIYSQNGNNAYGNMNFYNSFKNI